MTMSSSRCAAIGALTCISLTLVVAEGCASRERGARTRATPPAEAVGFATFYGPGFDGRLTASGTRFDSRGLVAAHPTYPFGTTVRVTSLENNRSVIVRIVDRGPARGPRSAGTIIDLSEGAARRLRMLRDGRVRVRVQVVEWGKR